MSEKEGVIKFQLDFQSAAALSAETIAELNAWRKVLVMMGMIGQTPERYSNYGFGNISRRLTTVAHPKADCPFIISGTQTGGIADLQAQHYATILNCIPTENRVLAQGPMKPSSESMTHGIVYAVSAETNWVFHAHDPHIWRQATALNIPTTDPAIPYGTPEMSAEVVRLFADSDVSKRKIFSMGGHEDGIVTFGSSAEQAGGVLLTYLAAALARI
ncbi:MAG: class II aldolase/adducin family protein [Candidatus Promineifilaceae bacterium]